MQIKTNPDIEKVFENYPEEVREKILKLRGLILETAKGLESVSVLEETLKWGEPSFITKNGSTIRIDWKAKKPEQYAMYFKCTSKLVPTFKDVFGDAFEYEGNRAIIFRMSDSVPTNALKKCISSALAYHKVKHLPNLGIDKA